jgi:hypothetical protein
MVGLLLPAIAASMTARAVNTTMNLPFSWDTLPRYTFCGNETAGYAGFPLRDSAVEYISTKQGATDRRGSGGSLEPPGPPLEPPGPLLTHLQSSIPFI